MDNEIAILALAALAQDTRLDTFRLLVKQEPEGLAAGAIARQLGVPHNTMSSHLAILTRAGLIGAERQSRSIVYRACLNQFRELTLFLIRLVPLLLRAFPRGFILAAVGRFQLRKR